MSKQGKRKITVELPKTKDLSNRPSVFERLGTKKSSSAKKVTEYCRQWSQHGSCAYGKNCKFATTHTLISPSKQRAANKDTEQKRLVKDDGKNRLHSTVVVRSGRSPDGEIDNWDQNDLEYADTDVLEKRRQQLQRELELQMKKDSTKDMRKEKKKTVSSSSSSRSSTSSSVSSSSSDGSSSSSSSGRDTKRRFKKGKLKRNSSSSSDCDIPTKKKLLKNDSLKRDKSESKKVIKKDDRLLKKHEATKKKNLSKAIGKKSLSPGKKSGGTPPITSKSVATKNPPKHIKSPQRKDRNRSASPHSSREKDKEKDRPKDKEREKEKEKDREKERDRVRARTRSPKKGRSRSPRRHGSHPKDPRRKESSERSRPVSPKKQIRREGSPERHRKRSLSRDRDRGRDHKERSLERKKDKHDEKERHDRKDRGRDRNKDTKREDPKRRGRERGLGGSRGDKGLEKPNKPMQRLLPRPEERLAALAAISNRALETDKNSSNSKDRQDVHSERGGRKQDRLERDRSNKRDRMDSIDRDPGDYEIGMDHQYDHGHNIEHYDRIDDRYEGVAREGDRSPGYNIQGRERHYDTGYDMSGPPRGYPEDDDRMFGESMGDPRGVELGYDDRRPHRDHSWEGRSGSMDRERNYMHSHKEWDNEDYRGRGDWGRERHWPLHKPQMNEWDDKEQDVEGWHHRGHPTGPHRGRMHDDYNRGGRIDHGRNEGNKRRLPRNETETSKEITPSTQTAPIVPSEEQEAEDKPIPDDLSEISDDPDDILEREDMVDQNMDESSQTGQPLEETKPECSEKESTQDTSGAGEEKDSQEGKDDEDVTNLDFEEISDGELEEERTRAGLGDALGVDWASLVADVHRREQTAPAGGARDRWRPECVLSRIGLSIDMAGKETVQNIIQQNASALQSEQSIVKTEDIDDKSNLVNGQHEDKNDEKSTLPHTDVDKLHPVATIQVAMEKRKRQRAVLFGSGCEITRGLSARRDLALRRYLCHLPVAERTGQSRVAPQPSLFHAARALFMQAPVTG
ncbi:zinc finger CCCH domain-containing protein 13-like [Vanessa tameamea]|uniref:Zinc finger CCCH domain-containing protein 13-like n=1 Tax=Vanessa tameamea TaxID=334116 RepID=A0A8B8HUD6_VANTA|nr:zinc finger CCCH domain-containing protein 13-like [Vanessa tameamea]